MSLKKNALIASLLILPLTITGCGKSNTNSTIKGDKGDKGDQGIPGENGKPGIDGEDGLSAFEIYKKYYGYSGSEKEWIDELVNGTLSVNYASRVTFVSEGKVIGHQIVRKGYNIKKPDNPISSQNKTFIGWFYNDTLWFFEGFSISEDITLTARFKEDSEGSVLEYDPFYPQDFLDTPYKLNVIDLEKNLTLNQDKTRATLFASGVNKSGGFYDASKNWSNDGRLCWAASSSNLIAWYLDRLESMGVNLDGIERNVEKIFDKFRENWNPMEGFDPVFGLAWYFTGSFLGTTVPPKEIVNYPSGGYLNHLDNVGDMWSIIDPVNHYPIVGNYSNKHPFLNDELNLVNVSPLEFSKRIISMLHYGPASISVGGKGASATGSHALTLWGCEFDTKTGMLTKVYLTDSDDEQRRPRGTLVEVKVKPINNRIELIDYYNMGDSKLSFISSATTLFHPLSITKRV